MSICLDKFLRTSKIFVQNNNYFYLAQRIFREFSAYIPKKIKLILTKSNLNGLLSCTYSWGMKRNGKYRLNKIGKSSQTIMCICD